MRDHALIDSLAESDYLAILGLIGNMHNCESTHDLERLIESDMLPLIGAETFGCARLDFDNSRNLSRVRHVLSIGLSRKEISLTERIQPYQKNLAGLFFQNHRSVMATGLDMPYQSMRLDIDRFFSENPEFPQEDYPYFKNITGHIAITDTPDFIYSIGFSRLHPNHTPFSARETRIVELLKPTLIHTLKYISLKDELGTFHALAEYLTAISTPLLLADNQGRVLLANAGAQDLLGRKPGDVLPESLMEVIHRREDILSPAGNWLEEARAFHFFSLGNAAYRVNLIRLEPLGDGLRRPILVQLKPALEPQTRAAWNMQQVKLTLRETEIASMVLDGLRDKEIAERLFLSSSTVNSHLKNIYRKINVHNRSQLVNALKCS